MSLWLKSSALTRSMAGANESVARSSSRSLMCEASSTQTIGVYGSRTPRTSASCQRSGLVRR